MTSFTTLLFTIHNISSTTDPSRNSCFNLKCPSNFQNQELYCVQILPAREKELFVPMYECALKEFKCSLGDDVKLNLVEMWKCYRTMPNPSPDLRRAEDHPTSVENTDNNELSESNGSQGLGKNCQKECSPKSFMVCARCNHGIYRSFMSDCYMRIYQCLFPNEKLELVSRRSCHGSAPYIFDEHTTEKESILYHNNAIVKDLTRPHQEPIHIAYTPKPTANIKWPSRHPKTRTSTTKRTTTSKTKKSKRTHKPKKEKITTKKTNTNKTKTDKTTAKKTTTDKTTTENTSTDKTTAEETIESSIYETVSTTSGHPTTTTTTESSDDTDTMESMTKRTTSAELLDDEDVTEIDVDICPNDENQEGTISVPRDCSSKLEYDQYSEDYMKVDLHPNFVEDGSPEWMVYNRGRKITSKIRADAGLMVRCEAFAGVDFFGNVVVRNKHDNDFLGFVFGYQSNKQFYLVTWKAKAEKYWIGWPNVVHADAGLHIKLVNSKTGPGPYLRNALYSTESIKHQVKLLWQDPRKQGWKHLIMYSWQLIHRPHIGLIRVKVFRGSKLIVDSGNIYDSTLKGGRIGVYSFSQENIEWFKMKHRCNDKIPSNLMAELPADLQKMSVVDKQYKWSNDSLRL